MKYYRNDDIFELQEQVQIRQENARINLLNEFSGIIFNEGRLIRNCDMFITEELVESCFGNKDLVRRSVLAEVSRVDVGLLDYLENGNDYKGLKRDLRTLIDLNDDADKKPSALKKGLRACKRIYQAIHDYETSIAVVPSITTAAGGAVAGKILMSDPAFIASGSGGITLGAITAITLIMIASYIYLFIYNFVLKFIQDYDDYKDIKQEVEENLKQLKRNKKDCKDEKLKKKYEESIEKIEERIKKIEKNRKDNIIRKAAGKWIDDRTATQSIDTKSHQVNRHKSYKD